MNAGEYMQWYYLIYLLPGGAALLLLLLSVAGRRAAPPRGRHGAPRAPCRRPSAHAGAKHAAHGAAAVRPSVAQQALAFFGAGRVPGPLVWGSCCWGGGCSASGPRGCSQPALHVPALFVAARAGPGPAGGAGDGQVDRRGCGRSLLPSEETFRDRHRGTVRADGRRSPSRWTRRGGGSMSTTRTGRCTTCPPASPPAIRPSRGAAGCW